MQHTLSIFSVGQYFDTSDFPSEVVESEESLKLSVDVKNCEYGLSGSILISSCISLISFNSIN